MRSLFPLLFSLLTPTLATQCYSGGFILIARGSEEPQGQSILEPIASAISSAIPNSGSNEVVYPALLSFWNSAPTGVINAQQQMQDYYAACPDGKMVLLGYSQGSFVMATALAGGNYSGQSFAPVASDIGENIAAIVLFGDQSHVPGQGLMATGTNCVTPCNTTSPLQLTGSYASTMQGYSDRLEEWCDDQDPICCSTGTNIQAHLSYWSQNTTDSVVQYVQTLAGNAQNASSSASSSASSTSSSSSSSSTASSAASSTDPSTMVSSTASATSSAEPSTATSSATASNAAASSSGLAQKSVTASTSPSATVTTSDSGRTKVSAVVLIWITCSVFLYI